MPIVVVRVTAPQARELRGRARQRKLTVSGYLRNLVFPEEKPALADAVIDDEVAARIVVQRIARRARGESKTYTEKEALRELGLQA
jgi:hypothetical protein